MKDKLMKAIDFTLGNLHWLAIALAFLVMLGAILTDRDDPQTFEVSVESVNRSVTPETLAGWYIENKLDFEVLDLRSDSDFESGHIKNAIHCGSCHSSKQEAREMLQEAEVIPDFRKKFILYTESGEEEVRLPRVLADKQDLYILEGGYDAWRDQILTPKTFSAGDSDQEREWKLRMNAMTNYFLGKTDIAAPPPEPIEPVRRRTHIMPSRKNEGC